MMQANPRSAFSKDGYPIEKPNDLNNGAYTQCNKPCPYVYCHYTRTSQHDKKSNNRYPLYP